MENDEKNSIASLDFSILEGERLGLGRSISDTWRVETTYAMPTPPKIIIIIVS